MTKHFILDTILFLENSDDFFRKPFIYNMSILSVSLISLACFSALLLLVLAISYLYDFQLQILLFHNL